LVSVSKIICPRKGTTGRVVEVQTMNGLLKIDGPA
jgi:hypothetical protein